MYKQSLCVNTTLFLNDLSKLNLVIFIIQLFEPIAMILSKI